MLYFSLFGISFLLQESELEIEACHLKVIGSDGLAGLWCAEWHVYLLASLIPRQHLSLALLMQQATNAGVRRPGYEATYWLVAIATSNSCLHAVAFDFHF